MSCRHADSLTPCGHADKLRLRKPSVILAFGYSEQAEIIEAFKSTSRYLDDLLIIDNPYFEGIVNRIYPPELQLNKANTSDTEAPFLDLQNHFRFENSLHSF